MWGKGIIDTRVPQRRDIHTFDRVCADAEGKDVVTVRRREERAYV